MPNNGSKKCEFAYVLQLKTMKRVLALAAVNVLLVCSSVLAYDFESYPNQPTISTDGESVAEHGMVVPSATAVCPTSYWVSILKAMGAAGTRFTRINVGSPNVCSSLQLDRDPSFEYMKVSGFLDRLAATEVLQGYEPVLHRARVRISCPQASISSSGSMWFPPRHASTTMKEEQWKQMGIQHPHIAHYMQSVYNNDYIASCTLHADSGRPSPPLDSWEVLTISCKRPVGVMLISRDPGGATPDKIETAAFYWLQDGDSLFWRGRAGIEWGHILFLPVGFTCLRVRSSHERKKGHDSKKGNKSSGTGAVGGADSGSGATAGEAGGGSGSASSSYWHLQPPSDDQCQQWLAEKRCPHCGHPDHREHECPRRP